MLRLFTARLTTMNCKEVQQHIHIAAYVHCTKMASAHFPAHSSSESILLLANPAHLHQPSCMSDLSSQSLHQVRCLSFLSLLRHGLWSSPVTCTPAVLNASPLLVLICCLFISQKPGLHRPTMAGHSRLISHVPLEMLFASVTTRV